MRIWLFRQVLQQLFLWRLRHEQPEVIVLGIDTMVLDNSEADVRHGVEPTYKMGVKGFQPLQITWGSLWMPSSAVEASIPMMSTRPSRRLSTRSRSFGHATGTYPSSFAWMPPGRALEAVLAGRAR